MKFYKSKVKKYNAVNEITVKYKRIIKFRGENSTRGPKKYQRMNSTEVKEVY